MKKPVIGITVNKLHSDGYNYEQVNECNINAVIAAGAIPFMLPITGDDQLIDDYLDILDGVYLSGGNDINPLLFGDDPIKEIGEIGYSRDEFEVKLYKKASAKNMAILGICRGEQVINVGAGGDLYQDIYVQKEGVNGHSPKFSASGNTYHRVKIMKDSILYDILQKEEINVNSYHHQAVRNVAEGFKVSALSSDGVASRISI